MAILFPKNQNHFPLHFHVESTIGMFCSQLFLLFPLAMVIYAAESNLCGTGGPLLECSWKNMTRGSEKFYEWPAWCEEFHGDLNLGMIDLRKADFENLHKIVGSLSLISTPFHRMPKFPNLKTIESSGMKAGVIILNNKQLRDMRPFVNWDKPIDIISDSKFPVFISGNRELDTVNLPRLFHKPESPLLCEKRMAPNYDIHFAEGMSLFFTLFIVILFATTFLYPLSMGDSNIYFVPGYHKSL